MAERKQTPAQTRYRLSQPRNKHLKHLRNHHRQQAAGEAKNGGSKRPAYVSFRSVSQKTQQPAVRANPEGDRSVFLFVGGWRRYGERGTRYVCSVAFCVLDLDWQNLWNS